MANIKLKLLVDKKKNKVVFAESDEDFVDILFSFLTLPMGTIIRLLDKNSSIRSMDKLYKSIENLDAKYMETEARKTMLLQPRSAAEKLCEDLAINVDDLDPHRLYRCSSIDSYLKDHRVYSSICGARCPCGKSMKEIICWVRADAAGKKDVFLTQGTKYIITDDLFVVPSDTTTAHSLFQELGIKDATALQERVMNVGRAKVLGLMKRLLVSKMPLSEVFLRKSKSVKSSKVHAMCSFPPVSDLLKRVFHSRMLLTDIFLRKWEPINKYEENEFVGIGKIQKETETKASTEAKTISVKLFQNKITEKVLFAEAGNEFVDLLLSFLTFPLGSIVKLLNKNSSAIGSVNNLYHSVENLGTRNDLNTLKARKDMLLAPRLYPHFDISTNQLVKLKVNLSEITTIIGCAACWKAGSTCAHKTRETYEINSKLPDPGTTSGGGICEKIHSLHGYK